MSLNLEAATRVFMFNGMRLQDPDPKHTPEQVKSFYAGMYAELNNAEIEGPEQKGAELRYEFRKAVGTKGSNIDPIRERIVTLIEERMGLRACSGLTMILEERDRQINQEGWTPEHDDEHVDHSLAAAACAYAAPEPYYRMRIDIDDLSIQTWDVWPEEWDQNWDKRRRGAPGSPFKDEIECRLPYSADEYPVNERIRNLVKAGALIAAEIDRLLRKKQREEAGNA